MKLYTAALLASTVIVPASALAQVTTPPTQPQAAQTQPAQTGMQAPAAAEFVTQAANGNMFEIRSSQVALEKTQNEPSSAVRSEDGSGSHRRR
jgi:hypothetical protein